MEHARQSRIENERDQSTTVEVVLVAKDERCYNAYNSRVGFTTRLIFWFIILILQMEHGGSANSSDNVAEWTATPGDITVLANTAARFEWTHTITGPVDISWHYKGTRAVRALEYIMGFSNHEVYRPINGGRHTRIGYAEGPGSATMTLDNVTAEDQGFYEVKVVDLSNAPASVRYIVDDVELIVIQESAIFLSVRVDQETIDQSLDLNGTKVTLPAGTLLLPTRVSVAVDVSAGAPVPSNTSVTISVGKHVYQEPVCDHTRICSRLVPFFDHYINVPDTAATLAVVTSFPVQNLAPIELLKEFQLYINEELKWHTTPGNISVLANTSARFDWNHSGVEAAVGITWNYKEASEVSTSEGILIYSNNNTYYPTNMERYLRLNYEKFSGSATVIIDNVTVADEGSYSVHITDLSPKNNWFPGRKDFLDDSAFLDVIEESEIEFSISLDGQAFDISWDRNGTRTVLPKGVVEVPKSLEISVHIAEFSPIAHSISIGLVTGHQMIVCKDTKHCHGDVFFAETYDGITSSEETLVIVIDFTVQNLPPIEISKTFALLEYNSTAWVSTPGTLAVLVNTTATFEWVHTFKGPLEVTLHYKATQGGPKEPVLKVTGSRTLILEHTTFKGRTQAKYDIRPDSIILILDHVTAEDAGFYEVEVISYPESLARGQVSRNRAVLRVIQEGDISVHGRVNGEQFSSSYILNGKTRVLPRGTLTVPARLGVTVEVSQNAPVPDISIALHNGNQRHVQPVCADSAVCERHVPVFAQDVYGPETEAELIIVATFPVQNFPPITVRKMFVLEPKAKQVALPIPMQEHANPAIGQSMAQSQTANTETDLCQAGTAMLIFGVLLVIVTVVVIIGYSLRTTGRWKACSHEWSKTRRIETDV